MTLQEFPKLLFSESFSSKDMERAKSNGRLTHVVVELANGERYPVLFYTLTGLSEELTAEETIGNQFVAEPGMILVKEINMEIMLRALQVMEKQQYFCCMRPLKRGPIEAYIRQMAWPPFKEFYA